MSYLITSSHALVLGCSIRVRAPLAKARMVAREVAMYAGDSAVIEVVNDVTPSTPMATVVARFVRRGNCVVDVKVNRTKG
jgi:hypothetical protein